MVKNHRGYILYKTADHEKGRKIEKITEHRVVEYLETI